MRLIPKLFTPFRPKASSTTPKTHQTIWIAPQDTQGGLKSPGITPSPSSLRMLAARIPKLGSTRSKPRPSSSRAPHEPLLTRRTLWRTRSVEKVPGRPTMWTLAPALGMYSTYDVTSLTQVDSRRSQIIKEADSRPTGMISGVPEDAEDDSDPPRPRF